MSYYRSTRLCFYSLDTFLKGPKVKVDLLHRIMKKQQTAEAKDGIEFYFSHIVMTQYLIKHIRKAVFLSIK